MDEVTPQRWREEGGRAARGQDEAGDGGCKEEPGSCGGPQEQLINARCDVVKGPEQQRVAEGRIMKMDAAGSPEHRSALRRGLKIKNLSEEAARCLKAAGAAAARSASSSAHQSIRFNPSGAFQGVYISMSR